jgi:DegV family protein with EDD domain
LLMIDDLAHLQAGGRIGRARSLLGTLLSVKPIVSLEDGLVVPWHRARTPSRALQVMAAEAKERAPLRDLVIMHSNADELVDQFKRMLEPIVEREVSAGLLGPVIGAHVGEGAIGIVMVQAAST